MTSCGHNARSDLGVSRVERFAQAEGVAPALEPGQRLDDNGEAQVKIARLDSDRMELPRCRYRKAETFRQCRKSRLVDHVIDQCRIGNDEAERLGEPLAHARDKDKLRILLIEQDRPLALRLAEP